ncbi:MAG: hypothetical protein ACFE8P_11845, partial [Promethearchaeota archaeon]
MNKLIIKNGIVVDPADNINGESKDILIENGIVVDNFSKDSDIIEINASGKTVVPAALDIHAHVASQQVNWARLLNSNNSKFQEICRAEFFSLQLTDKTTQCLRYFQTAYQLSQVV